LIEEDKPMNAPCTVVFVPVPVPAAGSPSWPREARRSWRKLADDRSDRWSKRQPIPAPGPIDRDLVEQLKKAGRRLLDDTKAARASLFAVA
jgi:hypothetical protein